MLPGVTRSSVLPPTAAAERPAAVSPVGTISSMSSARITPGTAASSPNVAAKVSLSVPAFRILSISSSSCAPVTCAPGASAMACTPDAS